LLPGHQGEKILGQGGSKDKRKLPLPKDMEMLFGHICEQAAFFPVLSALRKVMDRSSDDVKIDLCNFRMTSAWC